MTPAAVVFDCDGVLVDSEPHSRRSWAEVLDALGHPGTEDDVAACTGLGFVPTHAALSRIAPLPAVGELWPQLMEALGRSFDRGLSIFQDSIDVLAAVSAARIPVAVVSASPRERLDRTLRAVGLHGRFAVSVAGDEVAAGKPAPDGYLAAMYALGVDPASGVAIEDSVMGVRSALAAGMRVVAVVREPDQRRDLIATGVLVVDRVHYSQLDL